MDVEQRARFEEWMKTFNPDRDLETWPDGKYAYQFAAFAWDVWRAALTPPEGYVMVPVEPTDEMIEAGRECGSEFVYKRMLAARPEEK